jgi:hypothetical protein
MITKKEKGKELECQFLIILFVKPWEGIVSESLSSGSVTGSRAAMVFLSYFW